MSLHQSATTIAPYRRFALRCLAFALLAVYLGWNAVELYLWHVPSSLLVALAGIPSPTTGGTRAMIALFRGDLIASLRFNPLAIPLAFLGVFTIVRLGIEWSKHRQIRLADLWLRVWLGMLAVAWCIQLTLHYTRV